MTTKFRVAAGSSGQPPRADNNVVEDGSAIDFLKVRKKNDGNVAVFKRHDSPYYICKYRVKMRDAEGGIRTVQRTLSTQTADKQVARKRANAKRTEDIARFHDRKEGTTVNLRDDSPRCGQIVDLYLAAAQNKSAKNVVRDFLVVVAEGAMILCDAQKARDIRLSQLTAGHMLKWREQALRLKLGLEPRTPANINYYMRTARSIFSRRNKVEMYHKLRVPTTIDKWRDISLLKVSKGGGFQQIPQSVLEQMDRRAKKYFLRIARWFERHGKTRFANHYRNGHACYLMMRRVGLRNSEVAGLTWQMLRQDDQGKRWVHLHRPYWEPKGSPGKVPIAQNLYDELVSIFGPPSEGCVLLGTKSDRIAGTYRVPTKFCRKYLDDGIYRLRGQFGCEMVLKYGIEVASKLLRHADIKTSWAHYVDVIKLRDVQPL
jgi:hypothetical protein